MIAVITSSPVSNSMSLWPAPARTTISFADGSASYHPTTLADGNDAVPVAGEDQHRAVKTLDVVGHLISVPQKELNGQERVVQLAHLDE